MDLWDRNFFKLPIGASRIDMAGYSTDFDGPVYTTPSGHRYSFDPAAQAAWAPPSPPSSPNMLVNRTLPDGRVYHDYEPRQNQNALAATDIIGGLAQGVANPFLAPGRALRGEVVTNGDVFELAAATNLGASMFEAPKGAIRSGAMRAGGEAEETTAQKVARMLREGRAADVTDDMMAAVDPQDMHRLYTSGATGADMPMDQASRMSRARDMGFDTDTPLYHETGKDFGAFDTGVVGARATDSDLPNGVFLKPDGKSIGLGGDGEVQMPVLARMGKTEDLIDRRHARSFFEPSDEYTTARMAADNYDTRMARDYDARFEGPAGKEWLNRDGDNYFAEADKFLAEWNAGNVDRASAARSAADDFLTSEGVDALRIAQDQGSLGRSVQTTIVRDPANIRSRFARFDPRLSHLRHLSAGVGGAAVGLNALAPQQADASLPLDYGTVDYDQLLEYLGMDADPVTEALMRGAR